MPLDTKQREALRLEFLLKANERDKWISDHHRKLDAELSLRREWTGVLRGSRARLRCRWP